MEVLSCSGVQYVGESDCPQQSSGTTFIFDGESDCVERGQQVQLADDKMDKLVLNAEGCQKEKQGEGERRVNELPADGHCGGALYFDYAVGDQKQPCNSLYFEDDNLNLQNGCTEPCLASDSSHLIVDTIESEVLSNIGEEGLSVSEPKWLEQDEAVPLWVKVLMLLSPTVNFFFIRGSYGFVHAHFQSHESVALLSLNCLKGVPFSRNNLISLLEVPHRLDMVQLK